MYTHYYIPAATETHLREYVVAHPFGHLITSSAEAGLHCTAVAFVPESSADESSARGFTLLGHLARRNPHAAALDHASSALVLFAGPHHYISPRWYQGRYVPTWNYIAVQAHGTLELIDDLAGVEAVLRRTITHVEAAAAEPWTLDMAPPELVARLLPGVRAFRLRVQKLEGAFKLSQDKPSVDRAGVMNGLRAKGDVDALVMADLIANAPGTQAP